MSPKLDCLFDRDFVLIRVNEAWCMFFGLTEELALGRSFMDFVPWSYRLATRNDILALGAECRAASHTHAAGFGTYTIGQVHWTYQVILDKQDRIAAYEAIGQSVPGCKRIVRLQSSASAMVH